MIPSYSVGQPVFIRQCWDRPFNIINREKRGCYWFYQIRARNNHTTWCVEDSLVPMRIAEKDKKQQRKVMSKLVVRFA